MSKVAVITGGSSGIGYAISKLLLANSYRVVIISRTTQNCKLIDNKRCFGYNLNLCNITEINNFLQSLKNLHISSVDVLINNAGVGYPQKIENISESNYQEIFNTNVRGLIFLTQKLLPIIKNDTGFIINTSSIAGIKGFADWSVYCASKYAVEGFTQSLRQEIRPRRIRVVSVRPGSVDTPLYSFLSKKEKEDFIPPQDIAKMILSIISLSSKTCVEDIFINNTVGDL